MTQYYIDEKDTEKTEKRNNRRTGFIGVILIAFAVTLVGEILGMIPSLILSRLTDDGGWRFVFDNYLPFIGSFIVILLYMGIWDRQLFRTALSPSSRGLKGNTLKMLLLGLLLGLIMNLICAAVAVLHGDLKFSVGEFDFVYMLVALLLVAIQSSTEELILRCYVFQALKRRYGLIYALIVSSVYFAAMHLGNPGIGFMPILDLVLWGILFALMMHYFDSLWFVCMVHTAWNYTQNFLLGLPNSGLVSERSFLHLEAAKSSIFYDFDFGIEGGLTSIIEMVILTALILAWAKKSRQSDADGSGIQ